MIHAVDTYNWPVDDDFTNKNPDSYIIILEIVLDVYFILAFIINFYISDNRVK